MNNKECLNNVFKNFISKEDFKSYKKIGNGLINDTYLVDTNKKKYILQKLNSFVFKNPINTINNILSISKHLKKKIAKGSTFNKEYIYLYKGINKKYYYSDADNNIWRLLNYIEDSLVFNDANNKKIVYQAAGAFAEFAFFLKDFDSKLIKQTIKDFNKYDKKYNDLVESVNSNSFLKVDDAIDEITFIQAYSDLFKELKALEKVLPLRLIHNDTKLNNVLFNKNNKEAVCVIDLDTVNSSFIMYDFGDLFRSISSPKKDDERKILNININLNLIETLFYAYAKVLKHNILKIEKESLIYGIKIITLSLATRFLNDYLNNSVYFKTTYEMQNLYRARKLIMLFKNILKNENNIYKLLKKYFY